MKISQLRELCEDAIRRFDAGEMFSEKPFILLVIPTARVPKGDKIRLCGRHGPLGDFLSCRYGKNQIREGEHPDVYYNNVSFDARKVLAFIKDASDT